jgi:hypothetical protein
MDIPSVALCKIFFTLLLGPEQLYCLASPSVLPSSWSELLLCLTGYLCYQSLVQSCASALLAVQAASILLKAHGVYLRVSVYQASCWTCCQAQEVRARP